MCIAVKYGIWNVSKPDPQALGKLRAAGYPELAARVLAARGIADAQAAHAQLDCSCELPSPYLLTEMDVAAGRVGLAMSAHEKIAVFGDYDVDGITATCLLTDFLRSCGADCISYIPSRLEEGYGLNTPAIEQLAAEGVGLIVTVDCGITALDEALRVVHIAVKNLHDLPRLQGAKPIQSDMGESYQQVRLYLDQGRQVLFSGTPCQVDGLYHYLGEHPERLLTCDVVCSGVSSPGVWSQLVRSMAYIKRRPPVAVSFCGKLPGEKERRFHVRFDGGAQYDAPFGKSDFGRGLRQRLFLRCSPRSADARGLAPRCRIRSRGSAYRPPNRPPA